MPRTLPEIIKAAEEQARQEKLAALQTAQVKTAAAKPASAVDVSDTKMALALAKIGRSLAQQLKQAEDESVKAPAASMTNAPGQSPQQDVAPTGNTPDLSPDSNIFTSKDTNDDKDPEKLTQAEQPKTEFLDAKTSAALARAVQDVHRRYEAGARAMAKVADQPLGGVTTDKPPLAGDKPEARPDAPETVGSPKPPGSNEAMTNFTAQDADKQHEQDLPDQVSSGALAAMHDDPPLEHVESGENLALKAAAVRALLTTLDPNSKLAASIRNRIAAMNKRAEGLYGGGGQPPPNVPEDLAERVLDPRLAPAQGRTGDTLVGTTEPSGTPDVVQTTDIPPPAGLIRPVPVAPVK